MQKPVGNRILSRLSRADLALLSPHLEAVDLPLLIPLETANSQINRFVSSTTDSHQWSPMNQKGTSSWHRGRGGATGLAVAGRQRARHNTLHQVAGAAIA
jgi:hypothetical protein